MRDWIGVAAPLPAIPQAPRLAYLDLGLALN
jgi:hypothetical protein